MQYQGLDNDRAKHVSNSVLCENKSNIHQQNAQWWCFLCPFCHFVLLKKYIVYGQGPIACIWLDRHTSVPRACELDQQHLSVSVFTGDFCLMITDQRCPLLKNDLFRQRRPQAENVRNWPMEKICGYDFGFVDPPGSSGVRAPRAVGSRSKIYLSACRSIYQPGCHRPTFALTV